MSGPQAKVEMAPGEHDAAVARATAAFVEAIRIHYGKRLLGLYLFGSRARGDHRADSDVDVAVVLDDRDWDFWREKMMLADLAYEPIAESGVHVQGWPVPISAWSRPETHRNPSLIRAMQRDGKAVDHAAA